MRIVTEATPPRIRLAHTVRDGVRIRARGADAVTDVNVRLTARPRFSTGGLYYARRILRDRFTRRFPDSAGREWAAPAEPGRRRSLLQRDRPVIRSLVMSASDPRSAREILAEDPPGARTYLPEAVPKRPQGPRSPASPNPATWGPSTTRLTPSPGTRARPGTAAAAIAAPDGPDWREPVRVIRIDHLGPPKALQGILLSRLLAGIPAPRRTRWRSARLHRHSAGAVTATDGPAACRCTQN
ncbi:hypothetical protein ACRAWG_06960 [Methylobacterium sp. P31]